MRSSFLFRKEYHEILKTLPAEKRIELTFLIFEYGVYGEVKENISEDIRAIFSLIKDKIDSDCAEYGIF